MKKIKVKFKKLTAHLHFSVSLISLTLIIGSFLVASCGDKPVSNTNSTSVKQNKTSNQEHILKLDNGEKWIANDETTEGVNNMIRLMDNFNDGDNTEAYRKLSDELQIEFNLILHKCTMEGDAHNELHKFLVPMKNLFQEFDSKKLPSCKSSFNELKIHLDKYKEYFK